MSQNLKLFDTHTQYDTYINGQNKILPNVSHCKDNGDIHYNPAIHYLTTKELLEIIHNSQLAIQEKYNYNITQDYYSEMYNKLDDISEKYGLRIRNVQGISAIDVTLIQPYVGEVFKVDINIVFYSGVQGTYKGEGLSYDLVMCPAMLDEWNDNYVLRGNAELDQTAGGYEFNDEELEYFKTHLCLTFPKTINILNYEELAQISVCFVDDNGNYTFTQPEGSQMSFGNFGYNSESLSLTLFHAQDKEINDIVNDAVIAQRQSIVSTLKGDFSAFEALDDVKIPLTSKQYHYIKCIANYI